MPQAVPNRKVEQDFQDSYDWRTLELRGGLLTELDYVALPVGGHSLYLAKHEGWLITVVEASGAVSTADALASVAMLHSLEGREIYNITVKDGTLANLKCRGAIA